jgi:hypothetical protein
MRLLKKFKLFEAEESKSDILLILGPETKTNNISEEQISKLEEFVKSFRTFLRYYTKDHNQYTNGLLDSSIYKSSSRTLSFYNLGEHDKTTNKNKKYPLVTILPVATTLPPVAMFPPVTLPVA